MGVARGKFGLGVERSVICFTDQVVLRGIIDSIPTGILAMNSQGKIAFLNRKAASVLNVSPEEALHKSLGDLGITDLEGGVLRFELCCTLRSRHSRMEQALKLPQGLIWIAADVNPFLDENGNFGGVVVLFQDITEFKALEGQLKQTNRLALLGKIAAEVIHEIRNPISTISGALETFQRTAPPLSLDNEGLISSIHTNLKELRDSLANMLDLAKGPQTKHQVTDLRRILEHLLGLVKIKAQASDIQLVFESKQPYLYVIGSEVELKQLFLNIILNAIDSMPNGGVLKVIGEQEEKRSIIRLVDTGPGIPEEVIEALGRGYVSTKPDGTGIGLLVTKRIVDDHKGKLCIDSSSTGSRVTVVLPKMVTEKSQHHRTMLF